MQIEQDVEEKTLPNIFQQLENCQKEFLTKKNQLFRTSVHSFTHISEESPNEITFTSFNGWESTGMFLEENTAISSRAMHFLATNSFCSSHNGGYFLRYKNKGIVINPGKNFLQRFYSRGHNIREIDYVIVTVSNKEAYEDLLSLYTYNTFINQQLLNDVLALHRITYYLHPDIYPSLIGCMAPKNKSEKGCVQSLDHFEDTPQETIKLNNALELSYFSKGDGIAIKLTFLHEEKSTIFGYSSGMGFTPEIISFFQNTSLLLIGIGATPEEDIECLNYEKDHLGYFGTFSLLEQLQELPLLLLGEMQPHLGDIRLELVHKLQYDLEKTIKKPITKIIPLEVGFSMSLEDLTLMTNVSKKVFYKDTAVYRKAPFSELTYIAKTTLL